MSATKNRIADLAALAVSNGWTVEHILDQNSAFTREGVQVVAAYNAREAVVLATIRTEADGITHLPVPRRESVENALTSARPSMLHATPTAAEVVVATERH